MVGLVHTALLTIDDRPQARDGAVERLREWAEGAERAHVWTTLGHMALLAHLAADHGLTEFAAPLLGQLRPFGDRIAVIGQVGVAGPVALATARLRALLGDTAGALADLAVAEDICVRTGGTPALLRCRLLRCRLEAADPQQCGRLAEEADALGMRGVADAARRLAEEAAVRG